MEAAPRPSSGRASEDGQSIPDELEPASSSKSHLKTASASSSTSDRSDGAASGYTGDAAAGDPSIAPTELPRQPPASHLVRQLSPTAVGSDSGDVAYAVPLARQVNGSDWLRPEPSGSTLGSDLVDDVPCEATLSNSNGGAGPLGAARDGEHDDHLFSALGRNEEGLSDDPAILPYLPDSPPQAPSPSTNCVLCLVGDSLELMMAPGDVLAVKGQGRLTEIGTAHGMLGHVLLVLSPPTNVIRQTDEGRSLRAVWPGDDIEEIWRVRTLESTRSEQGLHEAEMLLYVDRGTGQLILIGELQHDGTLVITEHEAVELWQSPAELRSQIRIDLMARVLGEMKENEASWSHMTVARAMFSSAHLDGGGAPADKAMETVRESWLREPICTSVVIIFWQRYLCELAGCGSSQEDKENLPQQSLDLVLRWMPLKADRGLPGDLLGAMKKVGWVTVAQIPRIFRPMIFNGTSNPAFPPGAGSSQGGPNTTDSSCEARVMVAREVATGGA